MIIKVIPESAAEKKNMQEVEHRNVREFFMIGNKKDSDDELIDFHDWSGSYRYLIGSLYYFLGHIKCEHGRQLTQTTEINLQAPQVTPQISPIEASPQPQLIKKSSPQDGNIQGVVELDKEKPPLTLVTAEEMEVEAEEPNDSSPTAEEEDKKGSKKS